MKKILFVCTGNTCRSPMAEVIFKTLLKEKNIKNIQVSSCGVVAEVGSNISENAKKALESLGYKTGRHKAKQFEENMLNKYNLILTMTERQKQMIGNTAKKVFTISELTGLPEISDPYGLPEESYLITANQIKNACEILIDIIV